MIDWVTLGLILLLMHGGGAVAGHRAGEAAIAYEHGADIEALMPKLRHSDYFTDPKVQELAALERADSGYCRRVLDFVVGRKVSFIVEFGLNNVGCTKDSWFQNGQFN